MPISKVPPLFSLIPASLNVLCDENHAREIHFYLSERKVSGEDR